MDGDDDRVMSLFGRSLYVLVRHLRRRSAEENGTVILLVAAMLTGILAFGAYTIDIGSGRQAQTKAQSTADAAATAAAAAVAGGASTAAASNTATTVAQQNGAAAANIAVTYIASGATGQPAFQVRIRGDAATSVGNESGRSAIPVSASATAAVKVTTTTTAQTITNTTTDTTTNSSCASAGSNCLAIFAAQTGCSNTGVTLGGGTTVAGGVWSNSSLNIGGGGSSFQALTYGTGCSVTPAAGIDPGQNYQGNTFHNGLPQAQTPLADFPINYLADFPTCSGTGCTGVCATNNNTSAAGTVSSCATSLKTPSFCTQASTKSSWSVDTYTAPYTLITGQVYCAVGSGTPGNPHDLERRADRRRRLEQHALVVRGGLDHGQRRHDPGRLRLQPALLLLLDLQRPRSVDSGLSALRDGRHHQRLQRRQRVDG